MSRLSCGQKGARQKVDPISCITSRISDEVQKHKSIEMNNLITSTISPSSLKILTCCISCFLLNAISVIGNKPMDTEDLVVDNDIDITVPSKWNLGSTWYLQLSSCWLFVSTCFQISRTLVLK